uniref:CSON000031 protein n=1 Tax=Culicoides sonorensis TaxID=179676 RepID=A0A336MDF6_CULSO
MKFLIFALTILVSAFASIDGKEVVCYVDTSSAAGYQLVSSIKPNICTMIDLAFAAVDSNGQILASKVPNLSNFLKYKGTAVAPKMLLSIGGAADWQSLQNFAAISKSVSLRDAFANSCLNTCKQYGLSGIDVDWEFPSSSDRANFVLLLKAVKAKLGPAGYLLTVAVGASNWWAVNSGGLDVAGVGAVVDYVKLMTYDFHANAEWDRSFGLYFNAPLDDEAGRDSIKNSLRIFSSVPSTKLILGLPLYGNAYVTSGSNSVGASYSTQWPSTGTTPSYNQICSLSGMTRVSGTSPQWTPYMYGNGLWISYEDTVSVKNKASLVNTNNLGGVMVWSLEKDDQTGACSSCAFPLMRAINNAVGRNVDCTFTISGSVTTSAPPPQEPTTTKTTTTTSSSGGGGSGSGTIEICSSVGLFKYPADCSKYYQCAYEGYPPYIQSCQTGLYWNNAMKYCDWNCID